MAEHYKPAPKRCRACGCPIDPTDDICAECYEDELFGDDDDWDDWADDDWDD